MRKPFQFRLTFIEISLEQTRQKRTILYILDVFFSKGCWKKHERERGGGGLRHGFISQSAWAVFLILGNFKGVSSKRYRKILQIIGERGEGVQ